jgi:hypothetical protein
MQWEESIRKQVVKQACEKNSIDGALEALGKSIALWIDKDGLLVMAISALSLSRRDAPTCSVLGHPQLFPTAVLRPSTPENP